MLNISLTPKLIEEKTNAQGQSPVKIFFQCPLGRTKKSTGIFVNKLNWDVKNYRVKKNHPLSVQLNQSLENQISDIRKKIVEHELAGNKLTISVIKSLIHGKKFSANIFDYMAKVILDLKGKFSEDTLSIYQCELNRLKRYAGEGLSYHDINPAWLRKYENYLINEGLATNSVHKSFKILKKFFNFAIRDKLIQDYPFDNYDNPKYKQTDRTYLTQEEVTAIEKVLSLPLSEGMILTVNYFLLGCYSGLRVSDWVRFNYDGFVKENRFILRVKKGGKLVSIEIHPLLRSVLERIKDLPPALSEPTMNKHLKGIAELAGIKKNLTTHAARHSFAVRCAELGISVETTSELMGVTVKSCFYYYQVTKRKIDSEFAAWNKLA